MKHDDVVTKCYELLRTLTPAQCIAIDHLDAGATHQAAADAAGVHRVTVTRWARHHPAFQAELNRRRQERAERIADRMSDVALAALDVIADSVSGGDVVTALACIRLFRIDAHLADQLDRAKRAHVTAEAILDDEASAIEHARLFQLRDPKYRDLVAMQRVEALHQEVAST